MTTLINQIISSQLNKAFTMKNKLFIIFLFIIYSASSYAEKINFCKTIEFDTGAFNFTEIKKSSDKNDCRNDPIPLSYNGIKDHFELSGEAYPTGGISYITWDDSEKKFGYDQNELDNTIRDIIKENKKFDYLNGLKYKVNIENTPNNNGALVVSDVVFLDNHNIPVSVIRTLFFYSQDNYAATYYSGPIKYTEDKKIDFLGKVVDLFKTMKINW